MKKSISKSSPKLIINKLESKLSTSNKEKLKAKSISKGNSLFFSFLKKSIIEKFPKDKQWIINQWKNIEKMRNSIEAPVDTMGVTKCGDMNVDKNTYNYQTLISLVLSSQTKDEMTFSIMDKLISKGLNINIIQKISIDELKTIIKGVNYHNNKAKYIKELTNMIINEYNGVCPNNLKDIIKLPGVGQKMGNLYMQACFNENTGIAVDTHVHRISNRLKWVNNTNQPEKTRKELEEYIPNELWDSINTILVGFGQTICKAIKPLCGDCLLKSECEYGIEYLKGSKKISKRKIKVDETGIIDEEYKKSKRKKTIKYEE